MEILDEGLLILDKFCSLSKWKCKGWVKVPRGLRHGDRLSSFLFTIVADALNDTIFFSKASLKNLQNLKLFLLVFEQLTRLKINLEKSTLSDINMS
ncbi:hypothetical protein CK203_029008 [Vitis vinifera]|uniref:Reverse transcriptase domain-containing protein n=1 Tax=Vitis vinifera TaxID=29760 RepID=A0A438DV17_VITVI|nr:hypothetical protein CK203_085066 [Vitis vinifera]RVW98049.1 hypothetical protein CK203_029008 [Vitis vinifera]